jgi:hypothetical protein
MDAHAGRGMAVWGGKKMELEMKEVTTTTIIM